MLLKICLYLFWNVQLIFVVRLMMYANGELKKVTLHFSPTAEAPIF